MLLAEVGLPGSLLVWWILTLVTSDSVFSASLLLPVLPLELPLPGPEGFLPKPFERNREV